VGCSRRRMSIAGVNLRMRRVSSVNPG